MPTVVVSDYLPVEAVHAQKEPTAQEAEAAGVPLPEAVETENVALGRMRNFCARILKALAPPLLCEIKATSSPSTETVMATPRRRSARISTSTSTPATGLRSKRALAAESALLKALGISPVGLAVQESALQDFQQLFDSPLREPHLRALAAVFCKTKPPRDEIMLTWVGVISAH